MTSTRVIRLMIAAALLALLALPVACGDGADTATEESPQPAETVRESAQDRAARLAAQTQLRNAQTAQETYYVENERYASSASQLKTVDDRLSPRVVVASGDASGFEISIEAADSAGTEYIIRKTPSRVEFVDGEGNSW